MISRRFLVASSRQILKRNSIWTRIPPITSHLIQQKRWDAVQISHRFNSTGQKGTPIGKTDRPELMLAFTCNKCETRSSHTISKQAYQKGTVLVQCPGCKNRHLIADNLKIFSDVNVTVEDILKEKGESVSSDPNDLVFEDIPPNLKNKLGHLAPDAPEDFKARVSEEILPIGEKKE